MTVNRRVINPWQWQDAYGFVQANEVSGVSKMLVCSGQGAVNADGEPQHAGDMRAQVALTMDNLETLLREAGFDWSNVVRLDYFTTDVDAFFGAMDIIGERLGGVPVASTMIGVTRLAYPEMMIEIEATAVA
jgi:enamine deaminase RidA (YjgF/YER057c/UK114 family)